MEEIPQILLQQLTHYAVIYSNVTWWCPRTIPDIKSSFRDTRRAPDSGRYNLFWYKERVVVNFCLSVNFFLYLLFILSFLRSSDSIRMETTAVDLKAIKCYSSLKSFKTSAPIARQWSNRENTVVDCGNVRTLWLRSQRFALYSVSWHIKSCSISTASGPSWTPGIAGRTWPLPQAMQQATIRAVGKMPLAQLCWAQAKQATATECSQSVKYQLIKNQTKMPFRWSF